MIQAFNAPELRVRGVSVVFGNTSLDRALPIAELVTQRFGPAGQRFTTGTHNLQGHLDFNFEQDPEAFRGILGHNISLVLAPWELSSTVWMTQREMERWAAGPPATRWLAAAAPSWLGLWKDRFRVEGFNPFDTLAVGVLTSPKLMTCEDLPVEIISGPNDVNIDAVGAADKSYLVVDSESRATRRAKYCHRADPLFHEDLMQRLLTPQR